VPDSCIPGSAIYVYAILLNRNYNFTYGIDDGPMQMWNGLSNTGDSSIFKYNQIIIQIASLADEKHSLRVNSQSVFVLDSVVITSEISNLPTMTPTSSAISFPIDSPRATESIG
jgi:hypothetical protein